MEQPEEYLDPDACFTEGERGQGEGTGVWHLCCSQRNFCQGPWLAGEGGSVASFKNFVPHLILLREVDTAFPVRFLP